MQISSDQAVCFKRILDNFPAIVQEKCLNLCVAFVYSCR